MTEDVAANLEKVRDRIVGAGGDLDRITIVAVTKQLPTSAVYAAVDAGMVDIGENYAQQLLAKVEEGVPENVRWHYLGPVQRNKVKGLAPIVTLWHGVDRVAAADVIATGARAALGVAGPPRVSTTSGDPAKAGCGVSVRAELLKHARAAGLESGA